MKSYAVVTTHNRNRMCQDLVRQLTDEEVEVVVVDNASAQPFRSNVARVIHDWTQPPNLSAFWNMGLNYTHMSHERSWEIDDYVVAVLNDDLVLPPRFVQTLGEAIKESGCDIAFPDQFGVGSNVINQKPPGTCQDLTRRMTGFAFAIKGSSGLRADTSLRYWYGDDDLEMQARQKNGLILVGGLKVNHLDENGFFSKSPALQRQAERDRVTFVEKWGFQPW